MKRNSMKLDALFVHLATFLLVAFASSTPNPNGFLSCLVKLDSNISTIVYTPQNTSFLPALNSLIQNARFLTPKTPKPVAILTPVRETQVRTAILCGEMHHIQVRIRSGGHDFEGSSYISLVPFFVLDMFNFDSITVDSNTKTAWVGVGATVGSMYYAIHSANSTLAFPAGFWPTVGVGGHVSGGGYGPLVRQFGMAADNVVDARIIDANGRILDRKAMGEDLFWAIRGGVGSSFAVISYFKLKLYDVPKSVVVFRVTRTVEQNAIQLVYKWQKAARSMPLELTLTVEITSVVVSGKRTVQAQFLSAYRGGGTSELLSVMAKHFPELGLTRNDCREIPWIQAYPFLLDMPTDNSQHLKNFLTNRTSLGPPPAFKWKVDFAQNPIPPEGLTKLFSKLLEVPSETAQYGWTVFGGGVMDTAPESDAPFPHRGKLMIMRQIVFWSPKDPPEVARSRESWVRQVHNITGKYVPGNPRAQYADYRDFDLGSNSVMGCTSIAKAKSWAYPYFKDNFHRLIKVKSAADPDNYFKNEQSIPLNHC